MEAEENDKCETLTPVGELDDKALLEEMEHIAKIVGVNGLHSGYARYRSAAIIREAVKRLKKCSAKMR